MTVAHQQECPLMLGVMKLTTTGKICAARRASNYLILLKYVARFVKAVPRLLHKEGRHCQQAQTLAGRLFQNTSSFGASCMARYSHQG